MKAKFTIVLLFMVAAGIVVMLATRQRKEASPGAPSNSSAPAAQVLTPTTIQVVYSTEKKDWIEWATGEFSRSQSS